MRLLIYMLIIENEKWNLIECCKNLHVNEHFYMNKNIVLTM